MQAIISALYQTEREPRTSVGIDESVPRHTPRTTTAIRQGKDRILISVAMRNFLSSDMAMRLVTRIMK